MTLARAVPVVSFKNCCMLGGEFDGVERKDFFQGMIRLCCIQMFARNSAMPNPILVADQSPTSPGHGRGRHSTSGSSNCVS